MDHVELTSRSDLYDSESLLTAREHATRERVRQFNETYAAHGVAQRWSAGEMASHLIPHIAALNVVGGGIEGFGCSGLGDVSDGLVAAELARVDFGLSAFFGIQSVLSMRAISSLGSEEQKQRWLPRMARVELVGSMGITEPDHGSDTSGIETTATEVPGGFRLNGRKRWVGNSSFADVNIIFAKDREGQQAAYVVETPAEGYSAHPIEGRIGMRSSWPSDIVLNDVFVPLANRLDGARDARQTAGAFNAVRPIAAWQALGLSIGAFEATLLYLTEREQFGRPLIAFQLNQQKLAEIAIAISTMRLTCIRVSRLLQDGRMTHVAASAAKMSTARLGREVVAKCRDLMGGNGLLPEFGVARYFADMEAVYTYDGTDHIQSLIVGKAVTGVSALR